MNNYFIKASYISFEQFLELEDLAAKRALKSKFRLFFGYEFTSYGLDGIDVPWPNLYFSLN